MKIILSIALLIFMLFQISCEEVTDPCDLDGDGLKSLSCLGNDCNDADKNSGPSRDADGDGVVSVDCTGGTDCDDNNAARFPGNPQFNEPTGLDSDCNDDTCGEVDLDGDGHFGLCVQIINGVTKTFGTDCDDTNPGIFLTSQVCGTKGKILVCRAGPFYEEFDCAKCIPQPNGTGVCIP